MRTRSQSAGRGSQGPVQRPPSPLAAASAGQRGRLFASPAVSSSPGPAPTATLEQQMQQLMIQNQQTVAQQQRLFDLLAAQQQQQAEFQQQFNKFIQLQASSIAPSPTFSSASPSSSSSAAAAAAASHAAAAAVEDPDDSATGLHVHFDDDEGPP